MRRRRRRRRKIVTLKGGWVSVDCTMAHSILTALLLSEALNRRLSQKIISLFHSNAHPIPPASFVSQTL